MPRPVNLTTLHRTERPVWRHRDWLLDSIYALLRVWLRDCPGGYDRHPYWRRA